MGKRDNKLCPQMVLDAVYYTHMMYSGKFYAVQIFVSSVICLLQNFYPVKIKIWTCAIMWSKTQATNLSFSFDT